DDVDHAVFVFEGDEGDAAGGAGALAAGDQARDLDVAVVVHLLALLGAGAASGCEPAAQQAQGVWAHGAADQGVVGHEVFADAGQGQGYALLCLGLCFGEQGQWFLYTGDGPAGLVAVAGEAAQGAGVGEQLHGSAVELAAQGQLLYRCEALPLSGCNQPVGIVLAEAADHAQTQADAVFALAVVLQGAVPLAVAHVYRPGFDAVAAGVLQNLVGAVKAHGP